MAWAKKIIQLSVCPINGMLVTITHNISIAATMNIQLIEKQDDNYRLNIHGVECLFTPMELFTNGLFPVKKCIVNGSFGWYVNRKFISYKKIKKRLDHGI